MGGRRVRERKNVRTESEFGKESRCHAAGFADDERGHKLRNVGASRSWKMEGN